MGVIEIAIEIEVGLIEIAIEIEMGLIEIEGAAREASSGTTHVAAWDWVGRTEGAPGGCAAWGAACCGAVAGWAIAPSCGSCM